MERFNKTLIICMLFFLTNSLNAQSNLDEVISLDQFELKLKQSKNPQILDVRSSQEYSENHLKGAINLDAANENAFNKVIKGLNKSKPVFVYSINNGRSHLIAKRLRSLNFKEVYELPGGLANWIGSGKPVESTLNLGMSVSEFKKLVSSNEIVLVEIGSKYCGGCKKLKPLVNEVVQEQQLELLDIELYDNLMLAKALSI